MYARLGHHRDFNSWKKAVRQGEVFVTSGPLLSFKVNGEEAGRVVRLPAGGGEVVVDATMTSALPLREFELVRSGVVQDIEVTKLDDGEVHRLRIRRQMQIQKSCWLAVRGRGVPIRSLKNSISGDAPWIETDAVAHSGIIRVIVNDQPIRSDKDATTLIQLMRKQQEYYRESGRYNQADDRLRMLDLFDQAIHGFQKRHSNKG